VEFLEEEQDEKEAETEEVKALAKEVADLMRATIRLNVKVGFPKTALHLSGDCKSCGEVPHSVCGDVPFWHPTILSGLH
jgi:hypothetical protein